MFRKTLFNLAVLFVAGVVSNFACFQAVAQQAGAGADTLVVCPQGLQHALQPWISYRMQQGHKIEIILPQKAEELRKTIHWIAANNDQLKTVVLVGIATQSRRTISTPMSTYCSAVKNILLPTTVTPTSTMMVFLNWRLGV